MGRGVISGIVEVLDDLFLWPFVMNPAAKQAHANIQKIFIRRKFFHAGG